MTAYDIAAALSVIVADREGGTVNRNGNEDPRQVGYYVGGVCPSLVFNSVSEFDRGEVAWWVGSNPAQYYGVWADSETGKVYVDAVEWTRSLVLAKLSAKRRGEIAIWDIAADDEIRIEYPQTQGE